MMDIEQAEERLELIEFLLQAYRFTLLAPVPLRLGQSRTKQMAAIQRITAQITYCYAFADQAATDATLRALGVLLPAILSYLVYACDSDEQTYSSVLRLLELHPSILSTMLAWRTHDPRRARRAYDGALHYLDGKTNLLDGKGLEVALLLFLQQCGLFPDEWLLRRRMQSEASGF